MSSCKLPKKHLPAKKAWKSFKASFQSKLQKLNISTAIKRTKNYCISSFNKLYALTIRSSSRSRYHSQYYRQQNQYKPSFSAIYIDELFPGQHSSSARPVKAKDMVASSSRSNYNGGDRGKTANVEKQDDQIASSGLKIHEKKAEKRRAETGETSASAGVDAWKTALLPQFRGVDERAEEFISKFREEMKLEREKSIIDFQEMLARSA